MKTYWKVTTKFFDNGKVQVKLDTVEADQKPENTMVEGKMCDIYTDYYDNYKDARQAVTDAKNT